MSRIVSITDTVPEPCRVAGTWLRPFCLGHHLHFKRLGFEFADAPTAEASREHILFAIAICAGRSHEWTQEKMMLGEWPAQVEGWIADLRGPRWNRRRTDWREAEELFRAYLADGYAMPPLMRHKSGSTIEFGAPWELMLKCKLVSAGWSETEVLNGYLPGRWYDYFTLKEEDQFSTMERAQLAGKKCHWRRMFYTQKLHQDLNGGQSNG